jgi:hypothetical protein
MDQAVSVMAQPGVAMHVEFNPVSPALVVLRWAGAASAAAAAAAAANVQRGSKPQCHATAM